MSVESLIEWERVGIELALEAGKMMMAASGRNTNVDEKDSFADLVTETDKAVEKFLFGEINRRFPSHKTIGEESASDGSHKVNWTNDPTWIIDPIDGTMNFVHTFPFTCVSIGVTVDKSVVLGIVYSPFLNKLYTAKKGFGAFCNGRPIKVRPCNSFREALLIAELGGSREQIRKDAFMRNLESIAWTSHSIRALGSAALNTCYIAEGFADGYFEFGLHCWDMAGCSIILTEAGGTVIDTKGGPIDLMSRRFIAAGCEKIARELSTTLPVHLELERD
jgi:myo-inositol-1(or 4)-monophosphatase